MNNNIPRAQFDNVLNKPNHSQMIAVLLFVEDFRERAFLPLWDL